MLMTFSFIRICPWLRKRLALDVQEELNYVLQKGRLPSVTLGKSLQTVQWLMKKKMDDRLHFVACRQRVEEVACSD